MTLFLVTMTFGIIQYGIIMYTANSVSQLSREAARYAAVHGTESDEVLEDGLRAYLSKQLGSTSIDMDDLEIGSIVRPDGSDRGDPVQVTIGYNLRDGDKLFLPAGFPGLKQFEQDYERTATAMIE